MRTIDPQADQQPLSVLFVTADLSNGGGVNRVITSLARMLPEVLHCRLRIVSARSRRPSSYTLPHHVQIDYARISDVGLMRYFANLFRLRRFKADYAVSFWSQDNILLMLALAFTRTRLILCEHISHDFGPLHVRLLRRIMYPFAWRVTVLNRADLAYYSRFLRNVRLVPNPVWPCEQTAELREDMILGVGHLSTLKGFDDLIAAASQSGLLEEGWTLTIVGEGPERPRLEALIRRLELRGAEIVPPTRDIHQWYRRAKLIAITSRVEAFSLVLAEAVQCGTVPVAYSTTGPAYLLEDFPAHLVPIGDVDSMADKLKSLAAADLTKIRNQMQRSISARTSPAHVANLWSEMLAQRYGGVKGRVCASFM